ADLALFVDGFSDPQAKFMHVTAPGGQELMTKLSSAMTPTSTGVTLKNSGILPSASELTPLLIGEEVVLFNQSAGVTVRGARNTTPIDHPSQVTVSLFGYSSKIRNGTVVANYPGIPFSVTMPYSKLPQTNATTPYNFGMNPAATVAGDTQNPATMIWEVVNTATTIGVVTGAINDYP